MSKRFRWFEPYFGAWYMLPARTNGSPFQKYGPTQTSVNPQQMGGVMIGVEQIAWENPRGDQRVVIEARAHLEEHFLGASAANLEPLAGPSTCTTNTPPTAVRASISSTKDSQQPMSTPRTITDIDNYATLGVDIGLNVQVKYIGFAACSGSGATCLLHHR